MNITYIFPPLTEQQPKIDWVIKQKGKSILTYQVDCRLLDHVSVSNFFELFLSVCNNGKSKMGQVGDYVTKINTLLNHKKQPILIIIKNIQYLLPLLGSVLLKLTVIKEESHNPVDFLFTTTDCLYSDRIYEQLKALPLILDKVQYFDYKKFDYNLRESEIIWNSLSEIQRRLIRRILIGETVRKEEFAADIDYLIKTGIISNKKQTYTINLPLLTNILLKSSTQSLKLHNHTVWSGEELMTAKFSAKQNHILRLLLENVGKVVSQDQIADNLWDTKDSENKFSVWAIDKFIQRLRLRMKQNLIVDKIIAIKTKGYCYQNTTHCIRTEELIIKDGLKFILMENNKDNVYFYNKAFQKKQLRKVLWQSTPKTDKEIIDWIKEVTTAESHYYFSIWKNKKMIGHVGLDRINCLNQSARMGFFLDNPKLWDKFGKTIFSVMINEAKNRFHLQFLSADVAGDEPTQIRILEQLGFKKDLVKKSLLTLELF